jgi:hypothetical protein
MPLAGMAEIVGIDDGRGDPALRGPADTDPDRPGRGGDRPDTAGETSADADLADTDRDLSGTGDDLPGDADPSDNKVDREIGRRR